jgi:hypothetical protein
LNREKELDRSIHSAAMKYRRASQNQRDTLKQELKDLVTQQFEVSQQRRELELKWHSEKKQQIIDRRVTELLSQRSSGQRGGDRRGPQPPDTGPPGLNGMPPRE